METKAFTVPVLVSLVSGKLLCSDFSKVHECAEFVVGHPMWTHEFGSESAWRSLRTKVLAQHPELDVDCSSVNKENWSTFTSALIDRLGESREIVKGSDERTKDPIETLRDIRPDADVIVVQP